MKNHGFPILFLIPVLLVVILVPRPGLALDNEQCLMCHSDETLVRVKSTGMKESLYLDTNRFKYSVHNVNGVGCTDCHTDLGEVKPDGAPPHSTDSAKVACKNCHGAIDEAYRDSVHGKAGQKGITIACYACHEYHYTPPLSIAPVSERQNNFCRKCHEPAKFHDWLPQKEAHFGFVECTVCHAPETPRHVNLRVFDLVRNRLLDTDEMLRLLGTDLGGFMALIDADNNGSIGDAEFLNLIFRLRRWGVRPIFQGEMVADITPGVHRINRGIANNDCSRCHTIDSPYFTDVRLVLSRSDGTIRFFKVERNVLGTYNVEFNALGSSRLRLLDQLGILMVAAGGLAILAHLTIRVTIVKFFGKNGADSDREGGVK